MSRIKSAEMAEKVRQIRRDAVKAGPATQQIAEGIAKKYGARVTPLNYKSEASISRKLSDHPNEPIKDGARTTIVAPADRINRIVAELNRHPAKSNYKEHTPDKNAGYSGHLFNMNIKGVTTEIQVNTPEMIFAKENYRTAVKVIGKSEYLRIRKETGQFAGWGHKYYEDSRSRKEVNPKRRKGNSSALDSRSYYENFRKK